MNVKPPIDFMSQSVSLSAPARELALAAWANQWGAALTEMIRPIRAPKKPPG